MGVQGGRGREKGGREGEAGGREGEAGGEKRKWETSTSNILGNSIAPQIPATPFLPR